MLEKTLIIHKLNKKDSIKTNCYHDYGIYKKDLGRNLKSLGETKDESIEIFKHKNKKILGMMWYPERHNNLQRSFELKNNKNLLMDLILLSAGKGSRLSKNEDQILNH